MACTRALKYYYNMKTIKLDMTYEEYRPYFVAAITIGYLALLGIYKLIKYAVLRTQNKLRR